MTKAQGSLLKFVVVAIIIAILMAAYPDGAGTQTHRYPRRTRCSTRPSSARRSTRRRPRLTGKAGAIGVMGTIGPR